MDAIASRETRSTWVVTPASALLVWLAGLVVPLWSGCAGTEHERTSALVFAAASLAAPFEALAREFESKNPDARIELHVAGTPQLVLQIREGAQADVLASADQPNMEKVVAAGQVASAPRIFVRNRLAIITALGNPKGIAGLADLAREDLRVVLCGPEVPAGRYAREALAKAGVAVRSISDEPSVKAIVSKVALGEVDAGIAYVTDAAGANATLSRVDIPEAQNVVAAFPIAVLSVGKQRAIAERFVAFALSPEGQRVLTSFGFASP